MIKLIVFDLDGVLVDAKELHYLTLNKAIEKVGKEFVIDKEEHLSIYDGLPTKKKLELLSINKGLPETAHAQIWENKQAATYDAINELIGEDHRLQKVLSKLKEKYKIYVASNSVKQSVELLLKKTGLLQYVDYLLSNEDVNNPKPHSEIYLKCMIKAGVNPKETIIIEDSPVGRKAALESGAYLCEVEHSAEVTYERISNRINEVNNPKMPWQSKNTNILIPMAGAGKRFQEAGYTFPKPLIDLYGQPMIQFVVENLNIDGNFIFVVQKEHYDKYNLKHMLNLIAPNCKIIQTDGLTEGAACTTLLAKEYINTTDHLLIANSDQFVEWDSYDFMYKMANKNTDGGILTFPSTHPKWSYVTVDNNGNVSLVAEKIPISTIANVGIYYWTHGSDYVKYCEQMIRKNIRTNNEFYIAPVYNEAIQDGKKIKNYNVKKMWGLGTPEDLESFKSQHQPNLVTMT
jgi:HAD superfamily hydrolase (TIGR01509 family)